MPKSVAELVAQAHDANASDIHLVRGLPPKFRVDGALCDMPGCEPLRDWPEEATTASRTSASWTWPSLLRTCASA